MCLFSLNMSEKCKYQGEGTWEVQTLMPIASGWDSALQLLEREGCQWPAMAADLKVDPSVVALERVYTTPILWRELWPPLKLERYSQISSCQTQHHSSWSTPLLHFQTCFSRFQKSNIGIIDTTILKPSSITINITSCIVLYFQSSN